MPNLMSAAVYLTASDWGFGSSGGEFSALLSENIVVSIFSSLREFWGLQRMETKFARPSNSLFFLAE